ncbi:MAG: HhoA/HhoB/HtrA family serine endopeptidase [Rhizonema sp. NSF051]|nr:HhoA/HhoB/HtrA family serine endopeptidase [Rhizonema sp. NSF051]
MKITDFEPETNTRNFLSASMFNMILSGLAMVCLGGCSIAANTLGTNRTDAQNQSQNLTQKNPETVPSPAIALSNKDSNFVVTVVKEVGPAVVRIDSTRTVTSQIPDESGDPFLGRFYGNRSPLQSQQRVEKGSGSGFIINANGQILTNSHVVDGADVVTVKLKDGRTFNGKVQGEDPVTDVAVVKIDANNLPIIALGNSDVIQPGEAVIAIGNPLGLNNTVTSGIVSATDRSGRDIGASDDKRVDYIQTDAAINPGNSGGPLLNSRGEVIAMNTAIIQGAQGLGFAIPINSAQRIAQELITNGKVDHPYLGVRMVTLTPEIKERIKSKLDLNLTVDKGVLLIDVVRDSPADKAGLKAGDVLQSINNQPVTTKEEVQKLIEKSQIGVSLQLQVQRKGQNIPLEIKPAPLPRRV